MSRIVPCRVISSGPTAMVPAASLEASVAQPATSYDPRPVAATRGPGPHSRRLTTGTFVAGRPSYDRRREIPLGLILDFVA